MKETTVERSDFVSDLWDLWLSQGLEQTPKHPDSPKPQKC